MLTILAPLAVTLALCPTVWIIGRSVVGDYARRRLVTVEEKRRALLFVNGLCRPPATQRAASIVICFAAGRLLAVGRQVDGFTTSCLTQDANGPSTLLKAWRYS